jgi:glycosyltransferase involved in cell wall biosynthesis
VSSPRRRLLLVSPLPPPIGGIATWTVAVSRSPLAERFELRIVDTAPSEHAVVSGGSRFRGDRLLDAVRILARLVGELARFRPDVVHVNTSYFWAFLRDGMAVWLAKLAGARVVMHFRGGDFPEFVAGSPPLARRAIVATLARADRLFALTGATRAFLERTVGADAVRYLPNFVELGDFGDPPDRASRAGPVEVLYVGWIIEAKGVLELLEAARRVPDARFTLVGPVQQEFVARIAPALEALGDRVRLLPQRPRAQVIELYRAADVFALPTWREGFPNVVLEAMAAGLPVVATPVGAIPDAVAEGSEGLLVPVRDADALAAAIGRLVADRALRLAMGARARARVEAQFSRRAVVERLGALYDELAPPLPVERGIGSAIE